MNCKQLYYKHHGNEVYCSNECRNDNIRKRGRGGVITKELRKINRQELIDKIIRLEADKKTYKNKIICLQGQIKSYKYRLLKARRILDSILERG